MALMSIGVFAFDQPGSSVPLIIGFLIFAMATSINRAMRREREFLEPKDDSEDEY